LLEKGDAGISTKDWAHSMFPEPGMAPECAGMISFLRNILRKADPTPEVPQKVNTAWLCIEMEKPDGTPYFYRELQVAKSTKITWTNQSGHRVTLYIVVRQQDDESIKEPISVRVPA
jgi:hypothetical protein